MRHSVVLWITFATIGLCAYAMAVVDIPRIVRVAGYTVSSASSWKAVSPQVAVLTKLPLTERSVVTKGQVIAELSAERYSQDQNIESEQAQLAKQKLVLGYQELDTIASTASHSMEGIRSQLFSLRAELTHNERELELISLRLGDLQKQQARQQQLVKDGFISEEAVETKNAEIWRLSGEQSAAARQQLNLKREIEKQVNELAAVELRARSQRTHLSREMATAQQEFNEHSSKRIQLVSQIDGIVTQISAFPGQMVRPEIPLLTVIPQDGSIEVILLLPSRSIGFVREGQRVSVRYQAYPHEHYGRHFGTVREISRIALPPQEVAQHIRVEEPVYTVRVKLPANHMIYQDRKLPISPGMVVEADVELDRLKVYQWLLEPLYRLGGRV